MKYSYTNVQCREAELRAFYEGETVESLMEKAGRALAFLVKETMSEREIDDVLFVCGGGNNGGDGFCAAEKLLSEGKDVSVLCMARTFTPACSDMKRRFHGEVLERVPRRKYALVVDCLFGTGLNRPIEGECAMLVDFINSADYIISSDVPSGLMENGIPSTPCVQANATLSMGLLKNCQHMCGGADVCGEVYVADIGLTPKGEGAAIWEDSDVAQYFPSRKSFVNKGDFGKSCILAGSAIYCGAPFLSAGASLKSGAGYTKLVATDPVYSQAIGRLPACVIKLFDALDGDILSSDSIAVGMGSGVNDRLFALLKELLESYSGTLILDADAINTLAKYGTDILKRHACKLILTPHPMEFSRLTGRSVQDVLRSAVELSRDFAREYDATIILKNNRSVITDGERVVINPTGSPALSKGGSGDVLTGFLAGTCARGVEPFEAACVSSYILGRAGELAEAEMGQYAPDATDVIRLLPKAILSVEKSQTDEQ